jgi:hypothetical protein
MSDVILLGSLMALAILFIVGMFAKLFRKAGPHEALVVYGFRGTRVIKGGGTVIYPMVETVKNLSLELMSFDVAPQQDLYTKQGVAVTVEAVAQIKVKSDPESIVTAAEQFLTKTSPEREGLIRLVMEGHLRGIIGQLTVEEIVKEPEMMGDRMRAPRCGCSGGGSGAGHGDQARGGLAGVGRGKGAGGPGAGAGGNAVDGEAGGIAEGSGDQESDVYGDGEPAEGAGG